MILISLNQIINYNVIFVNLALSLIFFNKRLQQESISNFYHSIIQMTQNKFQMPQSEANIIRETRNAIKYLSKQQRIKKASRHLQDALAYKSPRPNVEFLEKQLCFKVCNRWHNSLLWEYIRLIFSYIFMYLVVFNCNQYILHITMEVICLLIFICDTCLDAYVKSFDTFKLKSKYPKFLWGKVIIFSLLIVDLVLYSIINCLGGRPIRPFRILRVAVPVFYDVEMRKAVLAFISAYLDIIVFIIFQIFLIFSFALIASNALRITPTDSPDYRNQYTTLSSMFVIMYVVSTYDSYPDNQLIAIREFEPNYILFVVFIFMNMFIFSSIPGSLIYSKFKQTRSKILILDEIKQQTSLILAFVSLVGDSTHLKVEDLIQFLWNVYKGKIRFVEYIARICLLLDDNNHRYIQVNEFMQISKIMLQKPVMLPPYFKDFQLWVEFRKFVNSKCRFKNIVNHVVFEIGVTLTLITAFINSLFLLYNTNALSINLDAIFVFVFLFQLIVRIIAIGPQNFLFSSWNRVDSALIIGGVMFFSIQFQSHADTLLRMARIFRIINLVLLLKKIQTFKQWNLQVFTKLYKLFSTILAILPIMLKFIPILLFTFYVFGILGLQFFYYTAQEHSSNYSNYDEFSHFRDFIGTQLVMVQIMTEAGWSSIAYELASRDSNNFGFVILYFCLMHLIIVLVEATVVKGIYWEVFFTVKLKQENQIMLEKLQLEAQEALLTKKNQYQEIEQAIDEQTFFSPETLIKREFYQNKLDIVIFGTLKNILQRGVTQKKIMKLNLFQNFLQSNQITHSKIFEGKTLFMDINNNEHQNNAHQEIHNEYQKRYDRQLDSINESENRIFKDKDKNNSSQNLHKIQILEQKQRSKRKICKKQQNLNEIEQLQEVDLQGAFQFLLSQFVLNPLVKYSESISYPILFIQYLQQRLQIIKNDSEQEQFNFNKNILGSQESINFNTFVLRSLLSLQTSKREQKAMVFDSLVKRGLMSRLTADRLLKKKLIDSANEADAKSIIRTMLIQNSDEELIRKFQAEYFSDLYGVSFKQINKLSIQSLIKCQARLIYVFRNLCKLPRIQNTEFCQMLIAMQSEISNKLLKRGSLFKFVYKIDCESDVWFSIGYTKQQEMQIRFIKSGIWLNYKSMEEDHTYYGKDIFNWNFVPQNASSAQAYIKRFFQSFESLAFALLNVEPFFQSNPIYHLYDLYTRFINVESKHEQFCISKIMLVILSKEERRKDLGKENLSYSISDILNKQENVDEVLFTFDDAEMETFDKLKNLTQKDKEQLILEEEGLPFTYINDFIVDIFDVMEKYSTNFVYQVNSILKKKVDSQTIKQIMSSTKDMFNKNNQIKKNQKKITQTLKSQTE